MIGHEKNSQFDIKRSIITDIQIGKLYMHIHLYS